MELHEMKESARQVRRRFASLEKDRHGRSWTPAEIMLGLVGDVGDLSKLVQAKSGVRNASRVEGKLAHELADCMWSVLTLADCYDVDLEDAFRSTMAALNGWLDAQGEGSQV